jgi:hypothetical protein
MESMGRGVTDLSDPVVQAYLNLIDPTRAAAFRKQRTEDERLYQRGLAAGIQQQGAASTSTPGWLPPQLNPSNQQFLAPQFRPIPYPADKLPPPTPADLPDPWRAVGKYGMLSALALPVIPASALALTPETAMSSGLSLSTYQALGDLAKKLGLTE